MRRILSRSVEILRTGGPTMLLMDAKAFVRQQPALAVTIAASRQHVQRIVHGYDALAPPFRQFEVNPAAIKRATDQFDKYTDVAVIKDGNWDREAVPYEESTKYRSVEQRYLEGRPWSETDIYEVLAKRIERGDRADGCYTVEQLEARLKRIDDLYESIRTHGYDPSRSYDDKRRLATQLDQICVSIGRDGELIFCGGGNHRFSIAKVLELNSIPVRVVARHEHWHRHREAIANRHRNEPTEAEFLDDISVIGNCDIGHPDFEDLLAN